ncbi:MAG: hypothetical protein ABSF21_07905 [Dehalococcoidia bacterium]|jgi:hypothetical protein
MESRGDILNLDVGRLQKVGCKVTKLLKRECTDAVEAMYVLKATLYLLRCELSEAGVVIGNEAQLDAELTDVIDKAINEDK